METVEERYANDVQFRELVDTLCEQMAERGMTRRMVWMAAMLAFSHYDATLGFERGEESP